MKTLFSIAAMAAFTAFPCFAGETLDMTSVTSGQTNNVIHPINEGHMIIFTSTEYTGNDQGDAGTLLSGMTGTCGGTLDLKPPAVEGQGHCMFKAASGDMTFSKWVATGMTAEGAISGDWTTVGGTGVFEDATGGGTFVSATDRTTGKTQNTISGSIDLN